MRFLLLIILCVFDLFSSVGKISALNGKIVVDRSTEQLIADIGFSLEEKDIVTSDDKSKAQITMNDGTVLSIGKNSKLNINEYVYDEKNPQESKADFKFAEGTFKSITGAIGKAAPDRFKLETKSASIGIRGTIVVGSQEKIACTHGQIAVTSAGVTQILNAGTMTNTEMGKPPTPPTKIEANMLNDAADTGNNETSNSTNQSSQNNNNNSQSSNTESTQIINSSFSDISSNATNKVLEDTITNQIETKVEEIINKSNPIINSDNNTNRQTSTHTLPFYSINLNITEENSVGSTIFVVPKDNTKVTIASYTSSLGMDPVLILLKKDSDGEFVSMDTRADDNWTESSSWYNGILSLELEEGEYMITTADFPFNTNESIEGENNGVSSTGFIELYITASDTLSFNSQADIKNYEYNSKIDNKAYIVSNNNLLDSTLNNNSNFKILADSKVGTTMAIDNYGYFVTISDNFNSVNYIQGEEELKTNVFLDTQEIEDGSSWGYWINNAANKSSITNMQSVWVSGNQVVPSDNYSATFKGQVIGKVTNTDVGYIKLDSDNLFQATINIGTASITNSIIKFKDSLGGSWNGSFDTNGSNVNKNGFSANIINNIVDSGNSIISVPVSNSSNSLSGTYYGTNGVVQSIGGSFNMTSGSATADGVFKARKQ